MRRGGLDATAGGWNEAFNGGSVQPARELFFFGLDARDDWNSKEIFVDLPVEVKDFVNFGVSLSFGEMRSVTLLPQVLAGAKEGFCGARISESELCQEQWRLTRVLKFPSDDAVPLIEFQRKIAMALDPFGVVWLY